jgi:hypothetical protein
VDAVVLQVAFDVDTGEQVLLWQVDLKAAGTDGMIEAARVDVDAVTGRAKVVGRG